MVETGHAGMEVPVKTRVGGECNIVCVSDEQVMREVKKDNLAPASMGLEPSGAWLESTDSAGYENPIFKELLSLPGFLPPSLICTANLSKGPM